jgi:hypothetical protein
VHPSAPEMNRMTFFLFDMDNRIFGPYLAAMDRTLIAAMQGPGCACAAGGGAAALADCRRAGVRLGRRRGGCPRLTQAVRRAGERACWG